MRAKIYKEAEITFNDLMDNASWRTLPILEALSDTDQADAFMEWLEMIFDRYPTLEDIDRYIKSNENEIAETFDI